MSAADEMARVVDACVLDAVVSFKRDPTRWTAAVLIWKVVDRMSMALPDSVRTNAMNACAYIERVGALPPDGIDVANRIVQALVEDERKGGS